MVAYLEVYKLKKCPANKGVSGMKASKPKACFLFISEFSTSVLNSTPLFYMSCPELYYPTWGSGSLVVLNSFAVRVEEFLCIIIIIRWGRG